MASPPSRKPAPVLQRAAPAGSATPDAPDILNVLLAQHVLTPEQVDKIRHAIRINPGPAEHAAIQMGLVTEVQIAQALAAHSGLTYVKINPLDLDLDIVTKALSGPFARKHGMVAIAKSVDRITIAVHDPFAPFPEEDVKRVTGLDVSRVVATRSDVEAINKGFYDLSTSLKNAE